MLNAIKVLCMRKSICEKRLVELNSQLRHSMSNDKLLQKYNMSLFIEHRIKSPIDLFNKCLHKGKIPSDKLGIRIIYETDMRNDKFISYLILRKIKDDFEYTKVKDYIDHRKENGYEGLHLHVFQDDIIPIEIQIRNVDMDMCAKHGTASNYKV